MNVALLAGLRGNQNLSFYIDTHTHITHPNTQALFQRSECRVALQWRKPGTTWIHRILLKGTSAVMLNRHGRPIHFL